MENRINVAELLKDCPEGMELDCTMYDDIFFYEITDDPIFPIRVKRIDGSPITLTKYGEYANSPSAKCVIFPKGKTTWEGFQRPFKDGDILAYTSSYTTVFIYRNKDNEPKHTTSFYVGYTIGSSCYCNFHIYNKSTLIALNGNCDTRFATAEEKKLLFDAIKENGYRWNFLANRLEKLIIPNFKKGDKVRIKNGVSEPRIIEDVCDTFYTLVPIGSIDFTDQDNWELVPDKFDINALIPFESKVLIRNDEHQYWIPAFWGFKGKSGYTTTFGWCKYCIPYEGNEHLFKTKNDCDEFFKTWK